MHSIFWDIVSIQSMIIILFGWEKSRICTASPNFPRFQSQSLIALEISFLVFNQFVALDSMTLITFIFKVSFCLKEAGIRGFCVCFHLLYLYHFQSVLSKYVLNKRMKFSTVSTPHSLFDHETFNMISISSGLIQLEMMGCLKIKWNISLQEVQRLTKMCSRFQYYETQLTCWCP